MPRMILSPDAFDELPDGYLHSTEPDNGREELAFREYDDYAARELAERRYDDGERFAGLLADAERMMTL